MSYNPRKAAQVIARFASKSGGQLYVIKAVKLVYLADRESISRFGFPILDERRVSMPHGPVNSSTYSHINGEVDLEACGWSDFLEGKANHMIALARDNITIDDLDELSEADIECVDKVWEQFGHMDKWKIRDWTHDPENMPEWEDPDGGSREIPLSRIMLAVKIENADRFVEEVEASQYVDQIFKQLKAG